jgi:hypothetical protein
MRVFNSLVVWARRGRPEDEKDLAPHFWSAALAAVGVVLIAAPLVVLVFESMFLSPLMAALQAALVSLMLAAMTPAIEIVRRGLGRALPILCAGLFVGFAVAAALTVRYTERIPRPASFQYLQDFDKGQAYWVAPTWTPDPWTELVAGGRFQAGHPQPEFAGRPKWYSYRDAPTSTLAPPEARLVEDRETGSSRFLRIRVVSPRGGRVSPSAATRKSSSLRRWRIGRSASSTSKASPRPRPRDIPDPAGL